MKYRERREYRKYRKCRKKYKKIKEVQEVQECPMPDLSTERIFRGKIRVRALFTPDMKWRLVEDFGPHCFTEAEDGRLLFSADYTDMDSLVTWLMTFGAKAEVLEPAKAREIIRRNAEEILQMHESPYRKNEDD